MRYWWLAPRALVYQWRRRKVGASDEYKLFPAVRLPSTGRGRPPRTREVPSDWQQLLRETRSRAFRVWRDGELWGWDAPGDSPLRVGRLYSITKSVLSLAWGVADAEGRVPRLEDVVHQGLTVRQLLRMDSGLYFDEGFARLGAQVETYLSPHARRTATRSRLVDEPGADFHYNDYHSLLLGTLLERGLKTTGWKPSSGVPGLVSAWIYERILAPLELAADGAFVVDSRRHGFPKTESGLCLSAHDVLSLGRLVLQDGLWNGQSVVPPDWIRRSTDPREGWSGAAPFERYRSMAWGPWLSQGRGFYGWHWWGRQEPDAEPTVFAMGIHGQILVISRKHRAVAVRLADRWALKDWWPDRILDALDTGVFS